MVGLGSHQSAMREVAVIHTTPQMEQRTKLMCPMVAASHPLALHTVLTKKEIDARIKKPYSTNMAGCRYPVKYWVTMPLGEKECTLA